MSDCGVQFAGDGAELFGLESSRKTFSKGGSTAAGRRQLRPRVESSTAAAPMGDESKGSNEIGT